MFSTSAKCPSVLRESKAKQKEVNMRDGMSEREDPRGIKSQTEFLKIQNLSGFRSSLNSQFL